MADFTQKELNKKESILQKLRQEHARVMREHANTDSVRDSHNMLSAPFEAVELKMSYIMKQIKNIEKELRQARVVDKSHLIRFDGNLVVSYGCCALVKYLDDNEEEKLLIRHLDDDFDGEEVGYSICTPESPLGKLLMGNTKGFKGEYSTSTNCNLGVEILDVFVLEEIF